MNDDHETLEHETLEQVAYRENKLDFFTVDPQDMRQSMSADDVLRGFLARSLGPEHEAARAAWHEWSAKRLAAGSHKEAFHAGWDAAFSFAAKAGDSLRNPEQHKDSPVTP